MQKPTRTFPYVLFNLLNNTYAISCQPVKSMVILKDVTDVPKTPNFVRGVLNLRGKIIPVIDMRLMMELNSVQSEIDEFENMLMLRKQDHEEWINELEKSVKDKVPFKLTTDPHACVFGKWYDNYKTNDATLKFLLTKLDKPHKKIHHIALEVKKFQDINDYTSALQLIEEVKEKELKDLINNFTSIIAAFNESKKEIVIVIEKKENSQIGIIADEVISVEHLSDIEDEPIEGITDKSDYYLGVGKRKNGAAVFILNHDLLISSINCQSV